MPNLRGRESRSDPDQRSGPEPHRCLLWRTADLVGCLLRLQGRAVSFEDPLHTAARRVFTGLLERHACCFYEESIGSWEHEPPNAIPADPAEGMRP